MVSTAPPPDGSSGESFHNVGIGSCEYSAGKKCTNHLGLFFLAIQSRPKPVLKSASTAEHKQAEKMERKFF